jgi:hypothetical protein
MSIKEIIMKRDNLTPSEANELIEEARGVIEEIFDNGQDDMIGSIMEMEDEIQYILGLEPDYLDELLPV